MIPLKGCNGWLWHRVRQNMIMCWVMRLPSTEHENCFMDVPRLSTIQALLLLLKAREATPKRGYYYRSWMTLKTIISMAKDLELHEHYSDHEADRKCVSDPTECLIKTRIWQCIFACEIMVGGPQGAQAARAIFLLMLTWCRSSRFRGGPRKRGSEHSKAGTWSRLGLPSFAAVHVYGPDDPASPCIKRYLSQVESQERLGQRS